ncbi:MAG: hypothetical protein ACFFE8_06395 [Candidatus Heimdallarchaeota archaeon]
MDIDRITLEQAEAKFIESLSKLAWIIPCIILFEIVTAYATGASVNWFTDVTVTVLTTALWVVVALKAINIADKQLDAERKLREQRYRGKK